MPRFKLTIEYAGTRYSGWQIQKNARTVQGEIDRAAGEVTGRRDFELYGSSRTDAGVHAIGQIAHLDVSTSLAPDILRRRLNDELPADINILAADIVPHRFHARHDAIARSYLYQVARRRTAFAKPFVWWVKEALDLAAMREAAAVFVGMKDFASFAASDERDGGDSDRAHPGSSAARDRRPSTKVLVDAVTVAEEGDLILVRVEGSHFLWKMVRRMVGVLAAVGRGEWSCDEVRDAIATRTDTPARLTAPPSGLFLERVIYAGDTRDPIIRAVTPLVATRPRT